MNYMRPAKRRRRREVFNEAYRKGHADKLMGLRLAVCWQHENHMVRDGYRAGQIQGHNL